MYRLYHRIRFIIIILLAYTLLTGLASPASAAESMSEGAQKPVAYNAARNQVAFSVGPYHPARDSNDPNEDDWETGPDFTATYSRVFGRHFALETGLHAYATTFDKNHVEGERSNIGVEVMALYVPIHKRIMPYVGGGLGFYRNHLKVKYYDTTIIDEDGSAWGLVFKGGVRAHITQQFFLGGFVKAWINNQWVEFENGDTQILNFGGSSVNFEVGFVF